MKYTKLPDAEYLRALFLYDSASGILCWRKRPSGKKFGSLVAGGLNSQGYLVTRVDGKIVRLHRIIWKMVTGSDPIQDIDHRDLDRTNNQWANLREATRTENHANRRVLSCSSTKLKGAFVAREKFTAQIKKGGARYCLGTFDTAQAAHEAYVEKHRELYGEFSRGQ